MPGSASPPTPGWRARMRSSSATPAQKTLQFAVVGQRASSFVRRASFRAASVPVPPLRIPHASPPMLLRRRFSALAVLAWLGLALLGTPFSRSVLAASPRVDGPCDVDTDSDGVVDCLDGCPNDPNKIDPGLCGCGVPDVDSDGDGLPDCMDGCPNDPLKLAPGVCGCGNADTDSDGDGLPDCMDGCPNDPLKVAPAQCGCGALDTDTDGDGTADCHDACPNDPLKIAPGLCGCGVADTDSDGDGTPN